MAWNVHLRELVTKDARYQAIDKNEGRNYESVLQWAQQAGEDEFRAGKK
jgi:hypothetical protein